MAVAIETSIGDFTVDLYVKERPKCCLNFLKLCKIKKYTFHLFHTVQTNYVAQSGDPTGTGTGGVAVWSYLGGNKYFDAELRPTIKHTKRGLISMVSDGNNRHGSQFLITLTDSSDYLDKQNHSVFGEISEGIEVIDKFNETICDSDDKPYRNIRLFHTVVIDDPFPDPPGLADLIPEGSPIQSKEKEDLRHVEYDEELDEDAGLTGEQLLEKYKEREAKTNAKLLEILGDIPDADVAPPEDVLFVCKLNPVTTDEDLEIIFSKFGPIKCCEIIRDFQTGESKQYAFIEFENVKDCEKAYLKMDNVLIDDRRIHVDFSQSVSKMVWSSHKGFQYWRRSRKKGKKVEEEEQEDEAPQYNIKNFEKRNTEHYDYVFDDSHLLDDVDDDAVKKNKKKNKKEKHKKDKNKKRKRSSSASGDDDDQKKNYDSKGKKMMRKRHDTTSDDEEGEDRKKNRNEHKNGRKKDEREKTKVRQKSEREYDKQKYTDEDDDVKRRNNRDDKYGKKRKNDDDDDDRGRRNDNEKRHKDERKRRNSSDEDYQNRKRNRDDDRRKDDDRWNEDRRRRKEYDRRERKRY